MAKIDIVLVICNRKFLESSIKNLNLKAVNLLAILTDSTGEKSFKLGEESIPFGRFEGAKGFIQNYKSCRFLIGDSDSGDVSRMKNFLMFNGLPEENIVNFNISAQISTTWLANLKHVEEHGADFFATGNEYMRNGLHLKFIPRVGERGGVILADEHQNLRQSYLTAKYIFEHVEFGTIKFVLIGLAPDVFHHDTAKDFSDGVKNFQYEFALNLSEENPLKNLISDKVKKIFTETTAEQADLNFDGIKRTLNREFSVKSTINWVDDSQSLPSPNEENIQILKKYIELCHLNGAKPIGVVFPFAEITRKTYNKKVLTFFRDTIAKLETEYVFTCIDWLDHLGYDCFYDMTHLNLKGARITSALIAFKLNAENLIPTENFFDMSYDYFHHLAFTAPKKEYNAFLRNIFAEILKSIRSKEKIRIGFVACGSDKWCGDELYNLFAENNRFDTSIFICLESDNAALRGDEFSKNDFRYNVKQFKERGLKVFSIRGDNVAIPVQDVIISLTPYLNLLPEGFSIENLTPKTLIAYVPCEFDLTLRQKDYYKLPILRILWKMFFPSKEELKIHAEEIQKGMPRGVYSGYSRTDAFFKKDLNLQFDWKMARPDAKKIIYAPHWSADDAKQIITQWNYQFMYEFAKAHPEISWVIKPYRTSFLTAEDGGAFISEEYERYLRQWDDLPNAQVYTGAYYQATFATSDGIIHDGGAFIAEYQYFNKPMIFLTGKGEKFTDMGKDILAAVYLVDEKDLKGLVDTIKNVLIDGNDSKAAKRRKVFDKYLNYPKFKGSLASEFIYRNLDSELET